MARKPRTKKIFLAGKLLVTILFAAVCGGYVRGEVALRSALGRGAVLTSPQVARHLRSESARADLGDWEAHEYESLACAEREVVRLRTLGYDARLVSNAWCVSEGRLFTPQHQIAVY